MTEQVERRLGAIGDRVVGERVREDRDVVRIADEAEREHRRAASRRIRASFASSRRRAGAAPGTRKRLRRDVHDSSSPHAASIESTEETAASRASFGFGSATA